MKICFHEASHVVFLYSDDKGMNHLNKLLQDNPLFGNLFNIEEVLKALVNKLTLGFSINKGTGICSSQWIGNKIFIDSVEKEKFYAKYSDWKKELEKYLGHDNIYEVHIPCDELDSLLDDLDNLPQDAQEKFLLKFLEKYQFLFHLNETLNEIKSSKQPKKI